MINIEEYNCWVNNEYESWKKALLESIADDVFFNKFKSYLNIKRMLEMHNSYAPLFLEKLKNENLPWEAITDLDKIGNSTELLDGYQYTISSTFLRYVYYANKILNINNSNPNIKMIEIGGGYGGLCAIIHLLAKYKNIKIQEYGIFDLPEVQRFQEFYLNKTVDKSEMGIQNIKFLDSQNLESFTNNYNYCMSFYSLGEFTVPVKYSYINNVVSKIEHGFIIWNSPHSDEEGKNLLKKYHPNLEVCNEDPLTAPNNLEIKF